jgi:hypothetical protein
LFQTKLRSGIVRGRSCASILIVPRRKSSLVETFYGWLPWPSSNSITGHGSSPGKGQGRRGEVRGGHGLLWRSKGRMGGAAPGEDSTLVTLGRKKREKIKGRRGREKEKEKKENRKNVQTQKILGGGGIKDNL